MSVENIESLVLINDYLLVKPLKSSDKRTKEGIIVTANLQDDSLCFGEIVNKPHNLIDFQIGNIVYYLNQGFNGFPSFQLDPADPNTKYVLLNKQFVVMMSKKDKLSESL